MANQILGKNVFTELQVGDAWYPIFCAKAASYDLEQEEIETSSVNSGAAREFIPYMSSMTISCNGITSLNNDEGVISIFYLLQESIRRQMLTIRMRFISDDGDTLQMSFVCFVRTIGITRDRISYSQSAVMFRVSGVPSIGSVPSAGSMSCMEVFEDTWETVEGEDSISGAGNEGRSFAGSEVILVEREGTQHDYTDGTPGNREYSYDGTNISFDSGNPFNLGERIHVVWRAAT